MKIAIVTVGTRGDVQPYIAVACALMARGHDVKLSTHAEYDALIRAHGVEPGPPLRGSFRDLLQSDLGRAWLNSADSPRQYAKHGKALFSPLQEGWCEDAEAAIEGAEGVLFYGLALGALHAAERRGLPSVALAPWPIAPTGEIPPFGALWLEGFPSFLKRAAGHMVLSMAFGVFNAAQLAYRERIGLPPFHEKDVVHLILARKIPALHLFSETVLPRPKDWPDQCEVMGFPFVPALPYEPPRALADFLDAGPPPVYLGFGSMTGFRPEELAELASEAAERAGVRAVVASGWAGLAPRARDDVFVIDEIPHAWLFPQCAAVVHHGGVGTFHEGLRAGKPTVIAAFFGDQPFWGRMNEKLGTGPKALKRASITVENLAASIRAALDDRYRLRAAEIAARLREENGATRAAERIEQIITS